VYRKTTPHPLTEQMFLQQRCDFRTVSAVAQLRKPVDFHFPETELAQYAAGASGNALMRAQQVVDKKTRRQDRIVLRKFAF
jgi:hypothetical protein